MTTWYLARSAGLAALVLLSTSTALGAVVSRPGTAPARRYVVQYVHRVTAGLGLAVLVVHLATILADSYAGVGWRGALVPFASGYRPGWVALGTVAAYLFVGVAVLGLARGRLAGSAAGTRVWRGLHALAYLGWAAAIGHGFTSGSDSDATWVRGLYVLCLAGVVTAVAVRLARPRRRTPAGRFAPARPPVLEGAPR